METAANLHCGGKTADFGKRDFIRILVALRGYQEVWRYG